MEEAHAISCERGQWVCNEKRLIEAAGLSSLNALFAEIPLERERLLRMGGSCCGPARRADKRAHAVEEMISCPHNASSTGKPSAQDERKFLKLLGAVSLSCVDGAHLPESPF